MTSGAGSTLQGRTTPFDRERIENEAKREARGQGTVFRGQTALERGRGAVKRGSERSRGRGQGLGRSSPVGDNIQAIDDANLPAQSSSAVPPGNMLDPMSTSTGNPFSSNTIAKSVQTGISALTNPFASKIENKSPFSSTPVTTPAFTASHNPFSSVSASNKATGLPTIPSPADTVLGKHNNPFSGNKIPKSSGGAPNGNLTTQEGTGFGNTLGSSTDKEPPRGYGTSTNRSKPITNSVPLHRPLLQGSDGNQPASSVAGARIEKLLVSQKLVPPQWPDSIGTPQHKNTVNRLWHETKAYRSKVRTALYTAGLLDDPDKPKKLSDALEFHGTCEQMCPPFEILTRINEGNVAAQEKESDGDGAQRWPSPQRMVKALARSAAGQEAPLPMDVRSPAALRRTVDYLFHELLGDNGDLAKVHGFLWDRTRAVRRDFVFQSSMNAVEIADQVNCLERITRFHVVSLHLLSKDVHDADTFVEQQEVEQLGKALLSLVHVYDDCKSQNIDCANEAEFRAYYALFYGKNEGMLETVQSWGWDLWARSEDIQIAVNLVESLQNCSKLLGPLRPFAATDIAQNGFSRYFHMVEDKKISYTMACFAEIHFNTIRRSALRTILASYRKQRDQARDWTLSALNQYLKFDVEEDVVDFVTSHGLEFGENEMGEKYLMIVHERDMTEPFPPTKQQHSQRLVERKRCSHTIPQVIDSTVYEEAKTAAEVSQQDKEPLAIPELESDTLFVPDDRPAATSVDRAKTPQFGQTQDEAVHKDVLWNPFTQMPSPKTKQQQFGDNSKFSFANSIINSKPDNRPLSAPKVKDQKEDKAFEKSGISFGTQLHHPQTPIDLTPLAPTPTAISGPGNVATLFPSNPFQTPSTGPSAFSASPSIFKPVGHNKNVTKQGSPLSSEVSKTSEIKDYVQNSKTETPRDTFNPLNAHLSNRSDGFVVAAPEPMQPSGSKPGSIKPAQASLNSPVQALNTSPQHQLSALSEVSSKATAPAPEIIPEDRVFDGLQAFMFHGEGGILQHFIEHTVRSLLIPVARKFVAEDNEKTLLLEADDFRARHLSKKYVNQWRKLTHMAWVRREGRKGRAAIRELARGALRASQLGRSQSPSGHPSLQPVAPPGRPQEQQVRAEVATVDGTLRKVHEKRLSTRKPEQSATTSADLTLSSSSNGAPPTLSLPPMSTISSSSDAASRRRSTISSASMSQETDGTPYKASPLRQSLLSDPRYLANETRLARLDDARMRSKNHSGSDYAQSPYFRLKSMGFTTSQNGSLQPIALATDFVERQARRDLLRNGAIKNSTMTRKGHKAGWRSLNNLSDANKYAYSPESDDRRLAASNMSTEDVMSVKSRIKQQMRAEMSTSKGCGQEQKEITKRSMDHDEDEELFRRAKKIREMMDEDTQWFRKQSEELSRDDA